MLSVCLVYFASGEMLGTYTLNVYEARTRFDQAHLKLVIWPAQMVMRKINLKPRNI